MFNCELHLGRRRASRNAAARGQAWIVLALLALVVLQAGCASTSAQWHYSPPKAPAAEVAVDLSTAPLQPGAPPPPLVAMLHKVVILQRAGPLGINSYWDEYVLSVANHGEQPMTVESTVLSDQHGQPVNPGDNPWTLANAHKSWFEQTDSHGVTSAGKIGVGSVAAGALAPAVGGLYLTPAGYAVCAAIVAPTYAVCAIRFNTIGRKRVEAEFNQHRLVLPRTIPPGRVAEGSLFFPVTPGPQQLALRCRVADRTTDLTLPLTPLAQLHLKK